MRQNHKSDFRKICINTLKSKSRFAKKKKDRIIINKLINIIDKLQPKRVLLYIPNGFEVDISFLIKKLRIDKKIDIYIPYLYKSSFKIVKYRLPLYKNRFGIKESKNSFLISKEIDLAIVPIVGVDALYKRIGFGSGMYDRFFSSLSYKPILVFTQLLLCKSNKVLSNEYDIQADYIITA